MRHVLELSLRRKKRRRFNKINDEYITIMWSSVNELIKAGQLRQICYLVYNMSFVTEEMSIKPQNTILRFYRHNGKTHSTGG